MQLIENRWRCCSWFLLCWTLFKNSNLCSSQINMDGADAAGIPKPCEQKKKGKNWCVTVQIELFLKNWSRRAWNKGLEPSSPVLHVLYGLSCVLQRPFTRLVLAQFMYFGIERNWLPQFLLFIFWTVTFKQNEKEKEKNTEIVKLWQWYPWNVVVPCRWHHLFPKINGCRGLQPPLFF